MGMPLSRRPDPDSALPLAIPLPDDPSGRTVVDRDGWVGLPYLIVTALACLAGTYGTSFLAEYWPAAGTPLYMVDSLVSMGHGVWVVRKGIATPGSESTDGGSGVMRTGSSSHARTRRG